MDAGDGSGEMRGAEAERGERPRLVLVPGLGTDGRVLEPQMGLPARVEVPEWIDPLPRESLASYARRMAERVEPDPPMYLGGISLGSMLALEMARHLPALGVFVIGGTRDSRDVPRGLRVAARVARFVPAGLIRTLIPLMARKVQFDDGLSDADRREFKRMLRRLPVRLLKWQAVVSCSWELTEDPGVPEYSIHGGEDKVIQRDPRGVDEFIPGAPHLINHTHPEEVNAFIASRLGGEMQWAVGKRGRKATSH